LTVVLVVVHPVFLFSFYYFTQKVQNCCSAIS
jgi:hypothetical protein